MKTYFYPKYGKAFLFNVSTKYVREGECIPLGYGFAYLRPEMCAAVYMPIPLNFLWGCLREGYFFLARGVGYYSKHDRKVFDQGYDKGYSRGASESQLAS